MVVNRVVQIGDMKDLDAAQAARQTAAQAHTVYLKVESSAQRSAKKVLPILKMFPGKARTVIYFADTGADGRKLCAGGAHAAGAARTARRKKCGLEITFFTIRLHICDKA